MVALILLAALLQQQGPKSLDIDPAKVQPAVVVPAGTVIPVTLTNRVTTKNAPWMSLRPVDHVSAQSGTVTSNIASSV